MIKRFIVTGDTHGNVLTRLKNIRRHLENQNPEGYAVIILGDAGINYRFDEAEVTMKKHINNSGFVVYCVRGNHEERPENISTASLWYDPEVCELIMREPKYPNIRYLLDGKTYKFGDHFALILGGAYSVDKHWRLETGKKWFPNEQLTEFEMRHIESYISEIKCDFVFSHTCPISWQPRDLFLSVIDQSKVDNGMELWLEKIKDKFNWQVWLFGHYHDDRLIRPGVEMYFNDWQFLDILAERWIDNPEPEIHWLKKDPNYYMGR